MHNLILGVFFGWLLFSINGTETFWKTYRVLDKMGDTIAEGMVKDIVPPKLEIKAEPKPEPKEEIIVDVKREAYMAMCKSYGYSVKQCQTYWDQNDQTALTKTDKPVKIKQHKPLEQSI
jgi:hypothetical protein